MTCMVLGLDYAAVAMKMMGIEDRRRAFSELRAMEAAALEVFRSRLR